MREAVDRMSDERLAEIDIEFTDGVPDCDCEFCSQAGMELLAEVKRLRGVEAELRKQQDQEPADRPETGPMQFPNDWPGLFIRGDNAGGLFISLKTLHEKLNRDGVDLGIYGAYLRKMIRLLESCDAHDNPECQQAMIRPTVLAKGGVK